MYLVLLGLAASSRLMWEEHRTGHLLLARHATTIWTKPTIRCSVLA